MSGSDTTLSFQQLIDQLKGYCSSGQSGTMFIKTQDKHSARITLDKGEIIACAYSMKRGAESLPLIRSIQSGSFAFTEHSSPEAQKIPLPTTTQVLDILQGLAGGVSGRAPPSVVTRPVTDKKAEVKKDASEQVQKTDNDLNQNTVAIEQITAMLTKFIGPLASVLSSDYVANNGSLTRYSQFVEMIDVLSDAISDDKERANFKKQSMIMLGKG